MQALNSLKSPLGGLLGIIVGFGLSQLLQAHHEVTHSAPKPNHSPFLKVASPTPVVSPQAPVKTAATPGKYLPLGIGGGAILGLGSLLGYQAIARRRQA